MGSLGKEGLKGAHLVVGQTVVDLVGFAVVVSVLLSNIVEQFVVEGLLVDLQHFF